MRLRLVLVVLGAAPAACLRLATGLPSTRATLVRRTLPAVLAADDQDGDELAKEASDAMEGTELSKELLKAWVDVGVKSAIDNLKNVPSEATGIARRATAARRSVARRRRRTTRARV